MIPVRALQRFALGSRASERARVSVPGGRCELCSGPRGEPHAHVVELAARTLRCACLPCATLFADGSAPEGRYRAVPTRVVTDPSWVPSDAEWATLGVPAGLAFLVFHSALARWIGVYPSPAGPTESELQEGGLHEIAAGARLVKSAAPDVEALLFFRPLGSRGECFLAPIDTCYELVGLVRARWKGFDGGEDAWRVIYAFFAGIRARSRPLGP